MEEKLFITKQDKASKDTFFPIHLLFQRKPKIQSSKIEKCHTGGGGGGRKMPKKWHVLFLWPHNNKFLLEFL